MLAGKEYGGAAECGGCGSIRWAYIGECQLCGKGGCSECMEVRHLLRCGLHWTRVIKGVASLGDVSADFTNATLFESEGAAHKMKSQLEAQVYHGPETVVNALVCESCAKAAK